MQGNTDVDRIIPTPSLGLEDSCSDVFRALKFRSRHQPRQQLAATGARGLQISKDPGGRPPEPAAKEKGRLESQEERMGHWFCPKSLPLRCPSMEKLYRGLRGKTKPKRPTVLCQGLLRKATQALWAPSCLLTSHHRASATCIPPPGLHLLPPGPG